ncbi:MAG: hypothetical protein A3J59_03580 [Candidatus Buchananbacteria bacterium RIFCSPHIGHO2_02_FULL_56_16]|uniref:TrbC/VIRB2 family protein n=1 Tax=Candidatus Buchananbacteria bacterium RIFCSPHIGHO2_02_FULL_56_16 TaxID=1797542 RepID=A0A1G1YH86_9BACT|nr:MAG: hypothetical protein A3J59_03580 [Candidatus Buchananbacteria bacterium RIFCSPHIGHO2_02_FULL_56_16]
MKKFLATGLALVTMLSFALSMSVAPIALAAAEGDVEGMILDNLEPSANVYGQDRNDDPQVILAQGIADIIKLVLSILGIILIVLIIYAGFLWMTAAGNEDKISKAKKTIAAAVIGLAIVLSAYLITAFVITQLIEATGAGTS